MSKSSPDHSKPAPSLRDVAQELNVSFSLVSKVLSGRLGSTRVSQEVKEAILQKAQEMDYRPNPLAAALKQGRKGAVGVLIHPIGERGSEHPSDYLRGLSSGLDENGLRMWLRFFESDAEFAHHFNLRTRNEVDGLIVAGYPHASIYDMLLNLQSGGLPIVTSFERNPIQGVPNVAENMARQCYLTTRHLLARGARRIVHFKNTLPRYEGFLAAHADAGVEVDPRLVIKCNNFKVSSGTQTVAALLDQGLDFDGVVAQSDHQAAGAVNELMRRGKRVPEDVRVTGVDNSPLCEACSVPLTSITSEMETIGRTAARLLIKRLNGESPDSIIIEPQLVIRASS
ncbi:MAG TPA: LacI family DNA-binding transcriptional regulator [Rariglobus sp.]